MRRFFLPVFAVLAGGLLALAWDPVSALLAGDRVEVREAGPGAAVRLGNGASFGQAYPTEHQSPGGNPNAAQMAEMFGGRVNYSFVNGLPANSDVRADLGAVGRVDFLDEAGDLVGACTGAAISETHILTAGHCFYKDGAWRGFTEAIFQLDLLWPPNANPAVYTDYKPPLILELEIPQTEEEALAKANASRWAVKYPSGRDVGRDDLDYAVLPFRAGQWNERTSCSSAIMRWALNRFSRWAAKAARSRQGRTGRSSGIIAIPRKALRGLRSSPTAIVPSWPFMSAATCRAAAWPRTTMPSASRLSQTTTTPSSNPS